MCCATTACKGVVNTVQSLATALPHVPKEDTTTLAFLEELGDHASSRPIFHGMLVQVSSAASKLQLVQQVAPDVYYGSGDGIRSSFCDHVANEGQYYPCSLLEKHATKLYSTRAKDKAVHTYAITHGIIERDTSKLQWLVPSKTPVHTLTGLELRQRAFIHSSQKRTNSQKTARAKVTMGQLKEQVRVFESTMARQQEDTPELIKLFRMVTESGMRYSLHK